MTVDFLNKSQNILELPQILSMLADEAVSDLAKEQACSLTPSSVRAEVERRSLETGEACEIMRLNGSPSFSGLRDIRPSLERASLGGTLGTRELLDIAGNLRTSRTVRGFTSDCRELESADLNAYFHSLHANRYLEEKIFTVISGEDEISDAASNDLREIRRNMRAASARARESLQKLISSPSYAKILQEQIITMRSNRYVVPVKAEHKAEIPGLVHDVSASGATIFIEPMATVKANNELREYAAKEKLEIERILSELSAECASYRAEIESDFYVLTKLDFVFAKAKLAYRLNCAPARLSEKSVVLKKARHPLLDQSKAVPIDIMLGDDFDTLIITGPNTGGKTVTLKTVGLLALMNQCGLHIPVSDGSCLPVFSKVLADIGDEQSIEQNLSTFSSHMANIICIEDECDSNSLILFDELGAGTDPAEGAALAISIIESVRRKGALTVATTHYTELKIYATNESRVQNASCEFDVETLKPTYRVLIGIPGKSNAFAISRRLGLSDAVIAEAKRHMEAGNVNFESTIERLEQTRSELESMRQATEEKLRSAAEKEQKANRLKAELEVRLEKSELKAKREAEEILREARETAEQVFSELDEMKKHQNDRENASEINAARNELRSRLNTATGKLNTVKKEKDDRKSSRSVRPGDIVEVKNLGVKAEVISAAEDGSLELKAGIMSISANEKDVFLLENEKKPERKASARNVQIRSSVPREIDLRGMESLEAVAVAERYIDDALLSRLETVTIIHGKGTGALRTAIHAMLRNNRNVRSFRLGTFGEGESGVTIVTLR